MAKQTNNQRILKGDKPIKALSQIDINHLTQPIGTMKSWLTALTLLEDYFRQDQPLLNKKEIIQNYYVHGKLFNLFYDDFLKQIATLEHELFVLKEQVPLKASDLSTKK